MGGTQQTTASSALLVDGLRQPAHLLTDRHGLTHIYADNEPDLFFAQGFNAARHRLWQIDLWRRRGLGQLAEAFGYGFVAQDRASRLFLFQGDMEAEWAAYHPGTKAICEDFCRGINAYLDLIDRGEAVLPDEFRTLDVTPQRWSAADIVRIRSNTLTANGISELQRCALRRDGRDAIDGLRAILRPSPPAAEAPCDIADCAALITLLELATAPVIITRARLAATEADIEVWADPKRFVAAGDPQSDAGRPIEGSNNWVLSGAKTASGAPLLANDPHRALQTPALRYAVHLCCPAFSIIGGGEPALPGISIGHNGAVAFGLTIFPADQEDVFTFNLEDAGTHPAIVEHVSSIAVRGGTPLECRTFAYGTSAVLRLDAMKRSGIALRTVWSEPGAAPYLGGLALTTVRRVADVRARLAEWRLPAVNYVTADVAGAIGWFVAGAIPQRRPGSGVVPERSVGDPWSGFVANAHLPTRIDPACGYVMSANEFNLPDGWDPATPLSYEWYENFRARRIHEVLGQAGDATVADSIALQHDIRSVAALDLLDRVRACLDPAAIAALPMPAKALLDWDGTIANDAPETRFFHHWLADVLKPAMAILVDEPKDDSVEVLTEALVATLDALPTPRRAEILTDTLHAAAENPARHQPQRRALFRHAIQDDVRPGRSFHAGAAWNGDDTTVHMGKSGRDPGFVELGASFRIVVDLADWDQSRWQNVPDQSIGGEGAAAMVPLLYSRALVEAAVALAMILHPRDPG
ncbi:penicillin acylase family protein [Beijerinckia sp. L45]|uniref:penicillin acylase family protein n=1 Tax=Beijerinckia sp. L45 TaxID=1641855 RepID=UPI00131BB67D|nr:penicillin acylase family protein [Beijerinckia sp. L45]